MAVVDPYAPCPCGSGQKFKWCCQKVEAFAEKAERLQENGQLDAALHTLEEGLRKAPDNPWLLVRKALVLLEREQLAEARQALDRVVAKMPTHAGAQTLLVRILLETEGTLAAVAQLQNAYSASEPEQRPALAPVFQLVGMVLARAGMPQAARAHLEVALGLGEDDPTTESTLRMVEGDPQITAWLRNPYRLTVAPEGLDARFRDRFAEAVVWADQGLWASAAAAFDALAADGAGPEAERNLAICRLWMADDLGAAEALGRYIPLVGTTEEAVDLEALRQLIAPPSEDDQIDEMQLIWPIRDRAKLLEILEKDAKTYHQGKGTLDPNDPNSPQVEIFRLLDRPKPDPSRPLVAETIPLIVGDVLVGQEIAALVGYDDGTLDSLSDRFAALAGPTLPPAHPKTKRVGRAELAELKLQKRYLLTPEIDRAEASRVLRGEEGRTLREVWARTRQPYLGGRTPEEAARAGDAEVPLRAALAMLEFGRAQGDEPDDVLSLRGELGVPPEPEIDPATVDIESLHLGRLNRVPADRLDDEKLLILYVRARRALLTVAMERAAKALLDRPHLVDTEAGVDRVMLFSDLANLALGRGQAEDARALTTKGREGDRPERRAHNAPRWDMLDVRLRARTERPEDWVPQLAIVLDRYRENPEANESLLTNLLDMGLIRLQPSPDRPEGLYLDSRPLQALLSRYGPKITTAAGGLGISATQGGIWTPEKEAASQGGGGIWTPGSANPPAAPGDKPKLIITGS